MKNIDTKTVESFGDEWTRFDQTCMTDNEANKIFAEYFAVFSLASLLENAKGFDTGCGSGRWARWVVPKVGFLHCIDPSNAIEVAKTKLSGFDNMKFHRSSVDVQCLPSNSQDFGYFLGVLHHVSDTAATIRSSVDLLKSGAPLLLYLYYSFDNRLWWFRAICRLSDLGRKLIYRLPSSLKHIATDAIMVLIYLPLGLLSRLVERLGLSVVSIPLYYYKKHSFYTMRTDGRDRFGTPLERWFTRQQIAEIMKGAGLVNVCFSIAAPYCCVVGRKDK